MYLFIVCAGHDDVEVVYVPTEKKHWGTGSWGTTQLRWTVVVGKITEEDTNSSGFGSPKTEVIIHVMSLSLTRNILFKKITDQNDCSLP